MDRRRPIPASRLTCERFGRTQPYIGQTGPLNANATATSRATASQGQQRDPSRSSTSKTTLRSPAHWPSRPLTPARSRAAPISIAARRRARLSWSARGIACAAKPAPRALMSELGGCLGLPGRVPTDSEVVPEPGPGGSPTHVTRDRDPRSHDWVAPLWWTDGVGQADPSHFRLRRT